MVEHYSAAKAAMFAIRTRMNHEAMLYFTASISVLAGVFVLHHLLRLASNKSAWLRTKVPSRPPLHVVLTRKIRAVAICEGTALPSRGHASVVLLYVSLNIVLMFAHVDNHNMSIQSNLASRAGWLAVANMVLVVFLSLKNTPLAFLTAWSYERLNILHQVCGYMTMVHVVLHVSCYCSHFVQSGRPSFLLRPEEIFGMVAGICFLVLVFSGAAIRPWWYELFYYIHISFWMVGIVMVGLHQPELSKKILFATCISAGMWALDRFVRMTRIAMYSVSNEVTLNPLPNGATRVSLKKPPVGAVSGKHCFLWIPRIRSCETHPFTVAALDPLEFVIASYDGFTYDLHQYALKHAGRSLKASVDGCYGTFPDPADFDKMVLIAGGSGASFTFGSALNALKKKTVDDKTCVTFIWLVRRHSQLQWFSQHLKTLQGDGRVSVHLYVTRSSALDVAGQQPENDSSTDASQMTIISEDTDKDTEKEGMSISETHLSIDSEKTPTAPVETSTNTTGEMITHTSNVPLTYKRPDVVDLIHTEIDTTPVDKRVLVMACGPDTLMSTVRDTTSACIRAEGPAVELHCEQFGW